MRPKMPIFWKISAQETSEKKRRSKRTARATKPVCWRMSKMLPMTTADKKEIMTVPHEQQILLVKFKLAHE